MGNYMFKVASTLEEFTLFLSRSLLNGEYVINNGKSYKVIGKGDLGYSVEELQ